jgi:methyl-accepting chemotaxis protein
MFKNMKISTRLIISSIVFLIPLGIMLFFIVTGAAASIRIAERERRGLSCLRSIAGLLRIASEDGGSLRLETVDSAASLLRELEREYAAIGPAGQKGTALIRQIGNDFMVLWNTGWDAGGLTHLRIITNLKALSLLAGNESTLFMDSGTGDYYLLNAGIHSIPRSWERVCLIGNLLRLSGDQAVLSASDSETAADYLVLLARADYSQVLSDIDAALDALTDEGLLLSGGGADEIFSSLASYRSSLEWFIASVQKILSLNQGGALNEARAAALKAEAGAIENSYAIMNACLDKLEISLRRRIDSEQRYLLRSFVLVILSSVLAFTIVVLSNIHISRSTAQIRGLFAALEKNDLSVSLSIQTGDEFGELIAAFNLFLEKLRAAFNSFNRNALMISSSVFDLSSSAREISTTANEQSASVAEILSTMEGNKSLSAQGAAKTQEVAELAARTQELSRRGAELRDANQDMMGMIRGEHRKIIEEINGLADILTRINESIALIDSIADQTRLIAFNASLEAAGAVDAGVEEGGDKARFSVVAAEIRRFADNVVDSTAEIKEQIAELQRASRSLVEEANNGRAQIDQGYERVVKQKEVFEQIVEVSQNVAVFSQQISNLSRQQEYAASQIFVALKEISAGVNQFVTATASTSQIADRLNLMSVEQRRILGEYRTGMTGSGDKQEPGE